MALKNKEEKRALAQTYKNKKIELVRNYIANQAEHHKKITFQQEYDKFIERYGFVLIKH